MRVNNGQGLKKGLQNGGETTDNNLSCPALTTDGYSIFAIAETLFDVPYTGEYPGLTEDQIAYLTSNGPWYAQKIEGNRWQADYASLGIEVVDWIDWGDAIEATDPKIRRPYRQELSINVADLSVDMTGYLMAELEYPL